jgi:hypothetical protein
MMVESEKRWLFRQTSTCLLQSSFSCSSKLPVLGGTKRGTACMLIPVWGGRYPVEPKRYGFLGKSQRPDGCAAAEQYEPVG